MPTLALDPQDIARLESMSVRARVIVEGALAGLHQNPHAGASIEFAEHKEYAPGDDIRRIDWKAVGRIDRYYLKRFEDETEMRTFLVLDASASMGYGRRGPSKLAYGSYLAAALAYLLAQQGDPAGLLVFDDRTRQYLPPRTRGGHIRDLLIALEAVTPAGRTEPGRALAHVAEMADRRSLIVIFTDLLDAPADLADRMRQVRSRGNDVVVFQILDPDEVELPYDEVTAFEAMEPDDARRLLVDPRDLAASFRRESLALRERWRQICVEARVEYQFATTVEPPAEVLRAFLFARQRARR
ncbi:MAG TPA: DUF58 domain-containing protein [Polyangia bacterium]|nr:DUF58 domain-containing protein [Polyangia bacterium]